MTTPRIANAVFVPANYPDGSRPGFGRLPCPHCGDLHSNPERTFRDPSLWTLSQVRALVAMRASRVCDQCKHPSTVSMSEQDSHV